MGIALMHYFHTQTSAVQDISPGIHYTALAIENRLVEVEAIQVEGHRANA